MENQHATDRLLKKPRPPSRPPEANFAEIARMITADAPLWLPAHLEWWSQGVRNDIFVEKYRPSKIETVDKLLAFEEAIDVLRRGLEDPTIRTLLELTTTFGRIHISIANLKDLSERAVTAQSSPALVGEDGTTKRGPGKPDIPGMFGAKTLCAARIFEAWRFLNEEEPGIKNQKAAQAAQAYWVACGGKSVGYGNPLNGWPKHFRLVRDNEISPGLKRLIWRRELEQCEQRGRPPWYLGTYFPYPELEISPPPGQ